MANTAVYQVINWKGVTWALVDTIALSAELTSENGDTQKAVLCESHDNGDLQGMATMLNKRYEDKQSSEPGKNMIELSDESLRKVDGIIDGLIESERERLKEHPLTQLLQAIVKDDGMFKEANNQAFKETEDKIRKDIGRADVVRSIIDFAYENKDKGRIGLERVKA